MATLITVTGRWLRADGTTPSRGAVVFRLSRAMRDTVTDEAYSAQARAANLDGEGRISIVLVSTTDPNLSPQGVTYHVDEIIDGVTTSYQIELRHDAPGGTVDLADVAPVTSSTVSYGVSTSHLTDAAAHAAAFAAHNADAGAHPGLGGGGDVAAHEADTTNVHGIADTANLKLIEKDYAGTNGDFAIIWQRQPSTGDRGPFRAMLNTVDFPLGPDHVLHWGYNWGTEAMGRLMTEPSCATVMECWWGPGPLSTDKQIEYYVSFQKQGSPDEYRPFGSELKFDPAAPADPAFPVIISNAINSWNAATVFRYNGSQVLSVSSAGIAFTSGYIQQLFNGTKAMWITRLTAGTTVNVLLQDSDELYLGGNSSVSFSLLRIQPPLRIKGNIGFFDTAPSAKATITGSRGGNAALAALITELAAKGLIADGTTA